MIWIIGAGGAVFLFLAALDRALSAASRVARYVFGVFRARAAFERWEEKRAVEVLQRKGEREQLADLVEQAPVLALLVELAPVLKMIAAQVQPNGGTSLYDQVHALVATQAELLAALDAATGERAELRAWHETHEQLHGAQP